jgi:hypothetical protein
LNRFGADLSKASQTSFTGEMMTQSNYCMQNTDVLYLNYSEALMGPIKMGLVKCFNLENKALRPIGDLTNGIRVDTDI